MSTPRRRAFLPLVLTLALVPAFLFTGFACGEEPVRAQHAMVVSVHHDATTRQLGCNVVQNHIWSDCERIAVGPRTGELTGAQDRRHNFGLGAGC